MSTSISTKTAAIPFGCDGLACVHGCEKEVIMPQHKCCVISDSRLESIPLIQEMVEDNPIDKCQFIDKLAANSSHEGEYYCILHLPVEAEAKKGLVKAINEALTKLMNDGWENFNYISCLSNEIKLGVQKEYRFFGATIVDTKLSGKIMGSLDLHNCYLHDSEFHALEGERLEFRRSLFSLRFSINSMDLSQLFVSGCLMTHDEEEFMLNDNYQFRVETGKIEWARFIDNTFEVTLKISGVEIKELDISSNIFYGCPEMYADITENLRNIDLPDLAAFKFDYFPRYSIKSRIIFWVKEVFYARPPRVFDSAWNQYKRFRELYKIAKEEQLFAEQSTYFTLMQRCLYLSRSQPLSLKIVSYLYRDISDYGQSVLRPLVALIAAVFLFAGSYYINDVNIPNAYYLSVTQTFVPFSILRNNELGEILKDSSSDVAEKNMLHDNDVDKEVGLFGSIRGVRIIALSILQSITSIALIACLLLGLRWNFRKA